MPSRRTKVALIAHDGLKADMVAFATYNRQRLAQFDLVATEITGTLLVERASLACERLRSGAAGGDAQIAALVAEGSVLAVIFLVDPLTSQPNDPDIQTVMHMCNVHNVPIATNVAAADLFVTSELFAGVAA